MKRKKNEYEKIYKDITQQVTEFNTLKQNFDKSKTKTSTDTQIKLDDEINKIVVNDLPNKITTKNTQNLTSAEIQKELDTYNEQITDLNKILKEYNDKIKEVKSKKTKYEQENKPQKTQEELKKEIDAKKKRY